MNATISSKTAILAFALALGFGTLANAQEVKQQDTQQLRTYSVGRESSIIGTVVKFDSASSTLPMGAHVLLQTSAGQIDVHLGNAKVLLAGHLELSPGDSLRIVGEPLALSLIHI